MHRGIVRDDLVVAVAHIARDLSHLPAAPTPDWCQRAATVLVCHRPDTRAWAFVVGASDEAWPRHTEASGFAEGASVTPGQAPERLGPALLRAVCAAGNRLDGVVSAGGVLGVLDPRPRGTGLVVEHAHIVVGLAPLPIPGMREGHPRSLVVCWDRPSARGGDDPGLRLSLASLLPVARDRLRQALGEHPNPWLSSCEQRVLDLLTDGRSVPEIAESLGRSPHTIHDHVKRVHAKLGIRGRGALLARVLGHQPPPSNPAMIVRRTRPMQPFRQGAFVDHRVW